MALQIDQLEDFNVTARHIKETGARKWAGPPRYHPSLLETARVPVVSLTARQSQGGAGGVSAGIQQTPASSSYRCVEGNVQRRRCQLLSNFPPLKYWQVSSVMFSAHFC